MSGVFYLHLLGATVWIGGLIVLGGLVPAVRQATDDREVIKAMARRFGVISWSALGLLVLTGGYMAVDFWSQTLAIKIGLVLLVAMLAGWHSIAGSQQSPRTRGMIQGAILVVSLVILWVATQV